MNVHVESTGRMTGQYNEHCREWIENWLWENASANVDAALAAYYKAHPHAPDNLTASLMK